MSAAPGTARSAALLQAVPGASPFVASSRSRLHSQRAAARVRAAASSSYTPPAPPFNVVITGGSKGVGRALATEFLRAGDNVVICARDGDAVSSAVEELRSFAAQQRRAGGGAPPDVHGIGANVARHADVAGLADFARDQLGTVDLWINNAGTNAYRVGPLASQDPEDIVRVVETNVLGVMLCCKEAFRIMKDQPSGGHVFLMDGAGADGGATPRFAAYGATKRGLAQLSKSLQAELRSEGLKKIGVHNLSPGMVTTELLMAGTNTPIAKFFVNCLAEEPQTVAEYLVPRVRQVPEQSRSLLGDGVGSSTYIRYLTQTKAYSQILARIVAGQRKNRFVQEG
ncbi:hypothetical protein ABPG77_001204 [Micractinium sp. CCAP 211/92]